VTARQRPVKKKFDSANLVAHAIDAERESPVEATFEFAISKVGMDVAKLPGEALIGAPTLKFVRF